MAIETPNGIEFSSAAKIYVCGEQLVQQAGMWSGYPIPYGVKVDKSTLAHGIILATIQTLEETGWIQLWQEEAKGLLSSGNRIMLRAVYSEAPGFSGRFLEATKWQDASLTGALTNLFPLDESPIIPFLDNISEEFAEAGILTRGGYGAHHNVWNTEWLTYLHDAWLPEVIELWNRSHTRTDFELIRRSMMRAVTARKLYDDDDDD